MIIYPYIPKRKPRKPNAKQRARKASWQALLEKYDIKPTRKVIHKSTWMGPTDHPRTVVDPSRLTNHIPSVDTGKGIAAKKTVQQYTGDAMIGIGQLHKSNAVPIFKQQDAIDISKMRRG
jgi:hypothetical protein